MKTFRFRLSRPTASMFVALGAVSSGLCAPIASAADASHLNVTHCWIRALPPSLPSSGYFTIANDTDKATALTDVSTPAFGMAMLHRTQSSGDTSKMVMVESAPVPAHGSLVFSPGGYHLMLEQPTGPLKVGTQLPMHFTFADGSAVNAACEVKPPSYVGQ